MERGGRIFVRKRGRLPAPLHFPEAFRGMKCFSRADKLSIARAVMAMRRERTRRKDVGRISMLEWLLQKRQTPHAIDRFWRQVLVSAINEDLDRMAAVHGFQVFWLGFLRTADGYEMGIPSVPLGQLYTADAWQRMPNVRMHSPSPVERIDASGFFIDGKLVTADQYICALPFEKLEAVVLPAPDFHHSPLTGMQLW